MINTYTYKETPQSKLHEFVMAFFNRIEFETGEFSIEFFVEEFYNNLVKRHKSILGHAFQNIYNIVKNWEQIPRTEFCEAIRQSNEIKEICNGNVIPWKEEDIPLEIRELAKTLFVKLYEDVLKGKFFQSIYGTRKEHYHTFKLHANNNFELCPSCGIWPMHNGLDDITDQYDHYLPKDIYPFSSVNFENLVPICSDCNSFQVKGNDDILSHTGKVFFPFDQAHKGIELDVNIKKNDVDNLFNIEWEVTYSNEDGNEAEIAAWKSIYKIESRHKTHIKGSIESWYRHYWNDFTDKNSIEEIPDERKRTKNYLRKLKCRKALEHNSLVALINTFDVKARTTSKVYSRYAN